MLFVRGHRNQLFVCSNFRSVLSILFTICFFIYEMGQNLLFYIKNNKRTNKKKNTDIIKKRECGLIIGSSSVINRLYEEQVDNEYLLIPLKTLFDPSGFRIIKAVIPFGWKLQDCCLFVRYGVSISVFFLDSCKAATYVFQVFHFPITLLGQSHCFLVLTSSIVILLEIHFQRSCIDIFALTFHGEFGYIYRLLVSKPFFYRILKTFFSLLCLIQNLGLLMGSITPV